MDIGKYTILIGLAASVGAIVAYLFSLRGNRKALIAGRALLGLTAICVVSTFGRLMWLVFHRQFQYQYVFEYSSKELRFPWTIAATWAGQEGSFLLWAFWTGIIGCLVAWKAGKWESRVMPIYLSVLTFLLSILAWLSPFNVFTKLSELPQGMGLTSLPPLDGQGLHPSLQNYWMAIHPPTIFFGFSSLAVPFCFAIAAMVWKDYGGPNDPKGVNWASRVMPWVLMTVATLGVGLMMGGYWAYETLGWHGFWGWDPVENSSLFPWIGALALAHGLVVQKSRGGMARTNIFLAIGAWLSFLWGTYLTRSGVLRNFSVHSFVSLASQPLDLLKLMMGVYGLGGLALLAWRWKHIPGRPVSDKALSRDTAMVMAVSLMILAAIVIGTATSWPLLSRLGFVRKLPFISGFTSAEGVAPQPIFYNRIGNVLIIPTLFIMGVVPFLAWGKTNAEKFLTKILLPWMVAIAGGFGVVYFVMTEMSSGVNPAAETPGFIPDTPRMLVVAVATLGLFAALSNIIVGAKVLRSRAKITLGGWLAHVGIGMLICGTIISNVYEKSFTSALIEGDPPLKTPFGYSLVYDGWTHDALEKQMEETSDPALERKLSMEMFDQWKSFDHALKIKVVDTREPAGAVHAADSDSQPAGPSFIAESRIFINNKRSSDQDAEFMRWPYIHKELFRDFYIVPPNDPERAYASATLREGEEKQLHYEYNHAPIISVPAAVRYKKFRMEGEPGVAGTIFRADLEITTRDGRTGTASPGFRLGGPRGIQSVPSPIAGMQGTAFLDGGMDAATKSVTAQIELPDVPRRWIVPITATNKPMVNFVWFGVITMGLGTLIAMGRRATEARKGEIILASAAQGVTDTEGSPAATAAPGIPEPVADQPKPKRKASPARA